MMIRRFSLLLLFLSLMSVHMLRGQVKFQYLTTVEEVCRQYPVEIRNLLESLDLDRKGLESVRNAWQDGQVPLSTRLLVEYYRNRENPISGKEAEPRPGLKEQADSLLSRIHTFYGQTARLPLTDKGLLDWHYRGPANDEEWAWALNRHPHLRTLLEAFQTTGDARYAREIDRQVQDWVIQSLPYPGKKSKTAMWRGLEVSFRVKVWAEVFYHLGGTGHLSDATMLLMLSSLPDHADYARNYHAQGNWLTMEMSGLARLATAWPEFRKSREWIDYSKQAMSESLFEQVYPDGVQTELSSSYHWVALHNFDLFRSICEEVGEKLPEKYTALLDSMRAYLVYTIKPNGTGLLNNDSDLSDNRDMVLAYAEQLKREDWQYIVTNGKKGKKPAGLPSLFFPWAGQLVSRNGFGQNAHWSFFDMGPWGTGHQHNDKLHISVFAYGRELLVDAGRFAYRGAIADRFRAYAIGSASHNVILIDGKGQAPGPKTVSEPLDERHARVEERFDYAWSSFGEFNELEGRAEHQRTFFYLRNRFWIVLDKITTDRPRKIEALWHWHPTNNLKVGDDQEVYTVNTHGNLLLKPFGKAEWQLTTVEGQNTPAVQGWYSEKYNQFEANATNIYRSQIGKDSIFGWLLFPYEKNKRDISAEIISQEEDVVTVRVRIGKRRSVTVTLPLNNPDGVAVGRH